LKQLSQYWSKAFKIKSVFKYSFKPLLRSNKFKIIMNQNEPKNLPLVNIYISVYYNQEVYILVIQMIDDYNNTQFD
jgi:ABC-type transport system involved in multi-copper enzyme maturation permease subunit